MVVVVVHTQENTQWADKKGQENKGKHSDTVGKQEHTDTDKLIAMHFLMKECEWGKGIARHAE